MNQINTRSLINILVILVLLQLFKNAWDIVLAGVIRLFSK